MGFILREAEECNARDRLGCHPDHVREWFRDANVDMESIVDQALDDMETLYVDRAFHGPRHQSLCVSGLSNSKIDVSTTEYMHLDQGPPYVSNSQLKFSK